MASAAWLTVIILVPAPAMVWLTVLLVVVVAVVLKAITSVLLLVKVKAPVLLEVAVLANEGSLNTRVTSDSELEESFKITALFLSTLRVKLVVPVV